MIRVRINEKINKQKELELKEIRWCKHFQSKLHQYDRKVNGKVGGKFEIKKRKKKGSLLSFDITFF